MKICSQCLKITEISAITEVAKISDKGITISFFSRFRRKLTYIWTQNILNAEAGFTCHKLNGLLFVSITF